MSIQPSAIQSRQLSKQLGSRMVLRDIDLRVASGQCVALTGDNGAGKTTLLRCLAGIARPSAGEVRWFGQLVDADPRQRRIVGMVAHESRLYAHLTLRENLLFAARMSGADAPGRRVDTLLEQIGLRPWADRPARETSRGTRQRLALARALIHDPSILLLDEPFSGLDATGRDWLVGILHQQQARGCAVCLTTHDTQHSGWFVDRTLVLRNGSLEQQHRMPREAANVNSQPDAA